MKNYLGKNFICYKKTYQIYDGAIKVQRQFDNCYGIVNKKTDDVLVVETEGPINFIAGVTDRFTDEITQYVINYTVKEGKTEKNYLEFIGIDGCVHNILETSSKDYKDCYLGENYYKVKQNSIYEAGVSPMVYTFSQIINNDDVSKELGKDTILVRNRLYSKSSGVEEEITYGIKLDFNRLRVITPIHSKMQNRFIPLYSFEETKSFFKKYPNGLPYMGFKDENEDIKYLNDTGVATIVNEVFRPFRIVSRELRVKDPLQGDDKIEFIKKFK